MFSRPELSPSRRLSHFLFGAAPATLLRSLIRYGGVAPAAWPRLALIAAGMAAFAPFGAWETLWYRRRIAAAEVSPAPVFILGHWRSGTTWLHGLLVQDPTLAAPTLTQACVPWNFLGKLGLLRWLLRRNLPKTRLIDPLPLHCDCPIEEGLALANMSPASFWHGFYFPRQLRRIFRTTVLFEDAAAKTEWAGHLRYFAHKLTLAYPGHRLVFKDPANTARIAALLELFPGAKFVYLQRNPYEVFLSMRRTYRVLLPELTLQTVDRLPADDLILDIYRDLIGRYLQDRDLIPPADLIELRYEDLRQDPMRCLQQLYGRLGLPGWEQAEASFRRELERQSGYRPGRYRFGPGDIERVRSHWQFALQRWPYPEPEP